MCAEVFSFHIIIVDCGDFTFRILFNMIEDDHGVGGRGFRSVPQPGGEAALFVFRADGQDAAVQQETDFLTVRISQTPDFQRSGCLQIPLGRLP